MSLQLCPVSHADANAFVARHHRHSKPTLGHRASIGAMKDGEIVGVVIIGRPVARGLDDGWTLEALRVATDGTRNACSFLYGAAWRAAKALGYRRLVTYTLASESGASLRAAGWTTVAELRSRGPKGWNTPGRPRVEVEGQERLRWEMAA